jgi:hypothetical protein
MNDIYIKKTQKSPEVNFNPNEGILELKGISIPEDAEGFYAPLIEWAEQYVKMPPPTKEIIIKIKLFYFNTSTSDYMMTFFKVFKNIWDNIKIEWYYEEEDEDMRETALHFEMILEKNFEYIVVKNLI